MNCLQGAKVSCGRNTGNSKTTREYVIWALIVKVQEFFRWLVAPQGRQEKPGGSLNAYSEGTAKNKREPSRLPAFLVFKFIVSLRW